LYFDEANIFDSKLKTIKDDIKKLEEELSQCKLQYSQSMKNLENISEEIHEKRAQIMTKSLKREPGVGAELVTNYSTDGECRFVFYTPLMLNLVSENISKSKDELPFMSELNEKFKML